MKQFPIKFLQGRARAIKERRGKTYEEYFGKERAAEIIAKKNASYAENERIMEEHGYLTIEGAARLMGVHERSIRSWDLKGYIKSFRLTPMSKKLFLKKDIEEYLKGRMRRVLPDIHGNG